MGFLGDLFTPTPAKQQEQLTTLIQKQTTEIMSSSKFGSAAAINQNIEITAIGADSKNKGIDIKQVASINVTAFLNDKTALDLKSDLKEKLTNSIKNEASNMPFGQEQNVNTRIVSVVDKSIDTKFSRESMVELNNAINQSVKVTAALGGENSDISLYQKADVIAKFTSTVASDIASKLIGNTTVNNSSDTKTTNFIAETIGAIGGLFNSALLGAYAIPIMFFALFICIIVTLGYVLKGGKSLSPIHTQYPATVMPIQPR